MPTYRHTDMPTIAHREDATVLYTIFLFPLERERSRTANSDLDRLIQAANSTHGTLTLYS